MTPDPEKRDPVDQNPPAKPQYEADNAEKPDRQAVLESCHGRREQ